MTTTRNQIYNALLALGQSAAWPTAFGFTQRRFVHFEECQKPALLQIEHSEGYSTREGRLRIRRLHVTWILYHDTGADPNSVPASTTATYMDALDALFPDQALGGERQTLGGLVFHVAIEGNVMKYEGDLDGQSIITVPLVIVFP